VRWRKGGRRGERIWFNVDFSWVGTTLVGAGVITLFV
jgi:hypothetical protein